MNDRIKDIANSFAEEYCSDAVYPSHLFKAVLHKSIGLVHLIETDLDKDYYYLQEWADVQMQLSPRASRPSRDLELSEEAGGGAFFMRKNRPAAKTRLRAVPSPADGKPAGLAGDGRTTHRRGLARSEFRGQILDVRR